MKRLLMAAAAAGALSVFSFAAASAEGVKVSGDAALSASANDNIYATGANELDDMVYGVSGELRLDADGEGGSFSAYASVDLEHYADASDEDADDYGLGVDGTLKLGAGKLMAGASHALETEDRKARTARRDTDKRSESTVDSAYAGFKVPLGPVALEGRASITEVDYDNVRLRVGGAFVLQDDRDRSTQAQSLIVHFNPDADVRTYLGVKRAETDYDLAPPASLHNRDSETLWVGAGVIFKGLPGLTGEIQVAWQERSFDAAAFKDVEDFGVEGDVTWTPTEATTVRVSLSRTIEEAVLAGSPAYVATTLGASVNQSLNGVFALKLSIQQEWDDHKQIDREDEVTEYGVGLAAKISDNVSGALDYVFTTEDSGGTAGGPGYDVGVISASITASF